MREAIEVFANAMESKLLQKDEEREERKAGLMILDALLDF